MNNDISDDPLVSIIIPTYYRDEHLHNAIKSAVNQTYNPKEIIVVDDSGEAYAQGIVSEYDVTYIAHEENLGAHVARNTGIQASSGDYIQLLDDDDELKRRKLELQMDYIRKNINVGVVYCGLEKEGLNHRPDDDFQGEVLEQALVFDHYPCNTTTMLIDREVIDGILPLTEGTKDEVGMIINLAQITKFGYVDEILVKIGVHGDHRGLTPEMGREGIKLIREYEQLYNQFPNRVKYQALQHQYRRYAITLLQNHKWSGTAITTSLKSCFFGILSSNTDVKPFGLAIASIFGNVGYRILCQANNMFLK